MTHNQTKQVLSVHYKLGQPLKVVKNGDNDYSVYAECSDGLVEINPKQEEDDENLFGIYIGRCGEIRFERYNEYESNKYFKTVELNEEFPILNGYYDGGLHYWNNNLSMEDVTDKSKMLELKDKVTDGLIDGFKDNEPDLEISMDDFSFDIDIYKVVDIDGFTELEQVNSLQY